MYQPPGHLYTAQESRNCGTKLGSAWTMGWYTVVLGLTFGSEKPEIGEGGLGCLSNPMCIF